MNPETETENGGREILLITAESVQDTGTVSFIFMTEASRETNLRPMPQKFGYVWSREEGFYSFNVFGGGRLVVGGGWTSQDGDDWEGAVFEALPSCTLLMDAKHLPWWKELTAKHGVEFRHHHHEGILTTS